MRRGDFHYELPEGLIAQGPVDPRSASRLLVMDGSQGSLRDTGFDRFPDLLEPGDLLVFNDTRVVPARLHGYKDTGGTVEILVERILEPTRVLAQLRASKTPKPGRSIILDQGIEIRVTGRRDDLFELQSSADEDWSQIMEHIGHVPLPPYIRRDDDSEDRQRYQTVYARAPGAVAAPTAGLHFDQALLDRIRNRDVDSAFLTLHVGAGTFQPVRCEDIEKHRMHQEYVELSEDVCAAVRRARARGGRVIAVGTTSVRALETASASGTIQPYRGETDIFIYPGYGFRSVDVLLTNFHLPESSLLMLVCAFGGYSQVMNAYHHAVQEQYRFYSYGDAMFVTHRTDETEATE
jgi:S-adenosylmethionine:tRNA ribosyltransferase-isomerase